MLDAAELLDKFHRRLLAHTRASGNVVDLIPHQCQQVDDLGSGLQAISGADLLLAAQFEVLAAVGGFILQNRGTDELAEILVGGHHICGEPLGLGTAGHGANHIVGLEISHFENRDVVGADDILDIWD